MVDDTLTPDERRAHVLAMIKDGERQLLSAKFNALMNTGEGRTQLEQQAAKIAAGLKRVRAEYADLLAALAPPAPEA